MRHALAHQARQPLRPAVAGDEAELDLGLAELGVLAGQAHGAGQRQLAASAEREAVDAGDDRLAQVLDGIDDGLPAVGVLLGRDRRLLRQLADVGAGDESLLARSGEDDHAHLGVVFGGGEGLAQLVHGGHAQGVEHLGPVDGDIGDVVFRFEMEILEVGHKVVLRVADVIRVPSRA